MTSNIMVGNTFFEFADRTTCFCFLVKELEREVEENLRKRAKGFESLMANLESKYTTKKKSKLSISDGTIMKRPKRSTVK